MKKNRIYVFLAACFLLVCLAGCANSVDQKVRVKKIEYLNIVVSQKELLVIQTSVGSLVVRFPPEKLKRFLSDVQPGDEIAIDAVETLSTQGDLEPGIFRIREIVLLPGGERYRP